MQQPGQKKSIAGTLLNLLGSGPKPAPAAPTAGDGEVIQPAAGDGALENHLGGDEARNYRKYEYETVAPHVGRSLLEIGSGLGHFSEQFAGRLDYPNLMGPWTISPRYLWSHDVQGTSPGPGGNFVEGRYGLTVGVAANLRLKWDLDLSWTRFGGAGRFNDINDRDFIAATMKFAF